MTVKLDGLNLIGLGATQEISRSHLGCSAECWDGAPVTGKMTNILFNATFLYLKNEGRPEVHDTVKTALKATASSNEFRVWISRCKVHLRTLTRGCRKCAG